MLEPIPINYMGSLLVLFFWKILIYFSLEKNQSLTKKNTNITDKTEDTNRNTIIGRDFSTLVTPMDR